VLRRQEAENQSLRSQYLPHRFWRETTGPIPHPEKIFAQVALGTFVSDLLGKFGVWPDVVLGYSLGESAGLFALRAWTDRDDMLARMNSSSLFVDDLTGQYQAARNAWGIAEAPGLDWTAGIVNCPPAAVRAALRGEARAYLLIINTPK